MKVRQASSSASDAHAAITSATRDWPAAPQILMAFSSSRLDPNGVSAALAERFPGSPVVGCTTSGEQLGCKHSTGSVALVGVWDSSIRWEIRVVRGLTDFDESAAMTLVDEMLAALGQDRDRLEPEKHFAVLLIDGLSMAEERVTAALAQALEGVPLVGGSAGDDLGFQHTFVYDRNGAYEDSAIFILASKGRAQVEVFKHQHYVTTPTALCVTKADPARRVVQEIDGYPAIQAYAAALGMAPAAVTPEVTFLNPITFSVNGEIYVRSIQAVNDDGSLAFYCGIEEGMVLEIGSQADMLDELRQSLVEFHAGFGRADLILGFNCILRALEAERAGLHEAIGQLLEGYTESLVGFDTYGEQLNGMHINQTLVALAISEAKGDSA